MKNSHELHCSTGTDEAEVENVHGPGTNWLAGDCRVPVNSGSSTQHDDLKYCTDRVHNFRVNFHVQLYQQPKHSIQLLLILSTRVRCLATNRPTWHR